MNKKHEEMFVPRFFFALRISFILVLGFSAPASAANSFWQKGQSLLKSLGEGKKPGDLTVGEIASGLKEALRVGTGNVVTQLGRPDGFNADTAVHIPLPKSLQNVKVMLGKVGLSGMLDELELKLNRAAEIATPKAKELFGKAIMDMSIADAKAIYTGPEDSATRYFQGKTSLSLSQAMRPVVENSLAQVGAVQTYDKIMQKYRALPFVPDVKADLTDHVVKKGMEGIFQYLAKEEAAIRKNPAKQTTDILKRVFGGKSGGVSQGMSGRD